MQTKYFSNKNFVNAVYLQNLNYCLQKFCDVRYAINLNDYAVMCSYVY